FHTVISKFNFKKIHQIHEYVTGKLKPDAHITEIAENKAEIENQDLNITPVKEDYENTINILSYELRRENFRGFTKMKQIMRLIYYELVKEILIKKTQVIPCYAAINEVQISPTGEVWTCSVLGKSMGNLRENNYDFKKIWKSQKADELRKNIKNKECWCPVANISYTNMICHPASASKIMKGLLTR
ncbi:MAG TPA: SPASM domain-containing protein, partial [Patescibacteria group bacterium]|nr:SPASM domain-containing protein [Patescibacteria group bacterium]